MNVFLETGIGKDSVRLSGHNPERSMIVVLKANLHCEPQKVTKYSSLFEIENLAACLQGCGYCLP
jgi:hypothetical protein